jgi:hypothetical protein
VATVENTRASQGSPAGTRGASQAGKQYRRQQTRPLVARESESLVCRGFERVLRLARLSFLVRTVGATDSTAVCGPVCTVVWQGSAGDLRPYADQVEFGETGCSAADRNGWFPQTPFERSPWRDGRFACVQGQVFVQTETALL